MVDLAETVWRVTDVRAFDDAGKELPSPMGPLTMGVVEFGRDRVMVVIGDGRSPSGAGEPPRFYASYTGPYRLENGQFICDPDNASTPMFLSQQVRGIRFEGDRRMVLTPPRREGQPRTEIGWERLR